MKTAASAVLAALLMGSLPVRAAYASAIDKSVAALVDKLELGGIAGFDPHAADLAVAVSVKTGDRGGELARVLLGLVHARVESAGARSIVVVPVEDASSLAAAEESARARGAEWLLFVGAEDGAKDRVRLFAQLRAIDRGLWVAAPRVEETAIYASAEGELGADDAVRTLLAVEPAVTDPRATKTELPRFEGGPLKLTQVDDRVLAMASCKLGSAAAQREVLFVLGVRTLFAFFWEGATLKRFAALDLGQLPRAKEPAREPIGSVACGKNEVLLGHSSFERGQAVHVELARGEQGLGIVRAFAGMQLGVLGNGRVVTGESEHGKNRLLVKDVAGALLDVAVDAALPAGYRMLAVSSEYKLVRYSDDLEPVATTVTSGAGARLFADGENVLAVTTSSIAAGDRDRLRLYSLEKSGARRVDTVDVNGAVYATALATPKSPELRLLVIAAWRATAMKTELSVLTLAPAAKAASR